MIVEILVAVTLLAGQDASSAYADPAFPAFGVIDTRGWSESDAVKSLQDLFAELEVDASWVLTDPGLSDETKTRRLKTSLGLWRPEIDRRAETLRSILSKNEIGRGLSPDQARAIADERVEALVSAGLEALQPGLPSTEVRFQEASAELERMMTSLEPQLTAICQDQGLSRDKRRDHMQALLDAHRTVLAEFEAALEGKTRASMLADGLAEEDAAITARSYSEFVVNALPDKLMDRCRPPHSSGPLIELPQRN